MCGCAGVTAIYTTYIEEIKNTHIKKCVFSLRNWYKLPAHPHKTKKVLRHNVFSVRVTPERIPHYPHTKEGIYVLSVNE